MQTYRDHARNGAHVFSDNTAFKHRHHAHQTNQGTPHQYPATFGKDFESYQLVIPAIALVSEIQGRSLNPVAASTQSCM